MCRRRERQERKAARSSRKKIYEKRRTAQKWQEKDGSRKEMLLTMLEKLEYTKIHQNLTHSKRSMTESFPELQALACICQMK